MYEYGSDGRTARTFATTDPEWTDLDRGLVLALLAEQAETCVSCGHPISECRDPETRGMWTVVEETCWPSVVAQATAQNVHEAKRRGVMLATRRTVTGGRHAP